MKSILLPAPAVSADLPETPAHDLLFLGLEDRLEFVVLSGDIPKCSISFGSIL